MTIGRALCWLQQAWRGTVVTCGAVLIAGSAYTVYATLIQSGTPIREYAPPQIEDLDGRRRVSFQAGEVMVVVRYLNSDFQVNTLVSRSFANSDVRRLDDAYESFDKGASISRFPVEIPRDLHEGLWEYRADLHFPLNLVRRDVVFKLQSAKIAISANPTSRSILELDGRIKQLQKAVEQHRKKDDALFEWATAEIGRLRDQQRLIQAPSSGVTR